MGQEDLLNVAVVTGNTTVTTNTGTGKYYFNMLSLWSLTNYC